MGGYCFASVSPSRSFTGLRMSLIVSESAGISASGPRDHSSSAHFACSTVISRRRRFVYGLVQYIRKKENKFVKTIETAQLNIYWKKWEKAKQKGIKNPIVERFLFFYWILVARCFVSLFFLPPRKISCMCRNICSAFPKIVDLIKCARILNYIYYCFEHFWRNEMFVSFVIEYGKWHLNESIENYILFDDNAQQFKYIMNKNH